MGILPRFLILAVSCGIAVVAMGNIAKAQPETPIDRAYNACLATDHGQTNAGMIECTGTAIDAWNVKLNQVYQQALASLDPKSQALLRESERQWVKFRTAEKAVESGSWAESRGTDIYPELMANDLNAIKERTSELQIYVTPTP